MTDVICLFHLGGEQGGSTLYSPCPLRLDLPPPKKNTHLCFLGLHECIRTSRHVRNNRLLLERITAVSIKPCEAGMKGVALVFILPVNYWYLPPHTPILWILPGPGWKMSPCIMGTSRRHVVWAAAEEREDREQNRNVLIVCLHLLFSTPAPRLTSTVFDLIFSSISFRLKWRTLMQTSSLLLFSVMSVKGKFLPGLYMNLQRKVHDTVNGRE